MLGRKNKQYELELSWLLELVNKTGKALQKDRAIVQEHLGTADQLRDIIDRHGQIGDAMRVAVANKRLLYPQLPESDT